MAPSVALAETQAHRVAVIDVAFIFKNHPAIKAQVSEVENELKSYDQELKGKSEELKQLAAELKSFKVGSPDHTSTEERLAGMESKLRLEMARKRKELSDAEAKIYYDNYQRIVACVKALADHNKIDLVLRHNGEEMSLEQGESVIRGVMKNVVYHNAAIDMTQTVMQYLDRMSVAGGTTAPRTTR